MSCGKYFDAAMYMLSGVFIYMFFLALIDEPVFYFVIAAYFKAAQHVFPFEWLRDAEILFKLYGSETIYESSFRTLITSLGN